MCHESSLGDSSNSFSSEDVCEVHFFRVPVSPADECTPRSRTSGHLCNSRAYQQHPVKRTIQLTYEKKLFNDRATEHQRGCEGLIFGDAQNLTGQHSEQPPLCDPTLSSGRIEVHMHCHIAVAPEVPSLCHPVLGRVSSGQG